MAGGEQKPHHKVVGRVVVVARGRGLGRWRRITTVEPDSRTVTVDRPWRIIPDRSSTIVIMNGLVETVFVNNQEVDCAKGLYLYYAGAINTIIDRHLCDRSLGKTSNWSLLPPQPPIGACSRHNLQLEPAAGTTSNRSS
ncbi:MAG: hypothetical protein ABSF26_12605 [Thermoguttaceae bacterium]